MAVLDPHALISNVTSYYHFNVEIHSELPRSITIFMCEIVEGVVRHRDFVAKLKIPNLFSWCSFAKIYAHEISHYTVAGDTLCMTCMKALQE